MVILITIITILTIMTGIIIIIMTRIIILARHLEQLSSLRSVVHQVYTLDLQGVDISDGRRSATLNPGACVHELELSRPLLSFLSLPNPRTCLSLFSTPCAKGQFVFRDDVCGSKMVNFRWRPRLPFGRRAKNNVPESHSSIHTQQTSIWREWEKHVVWVSSELVRGMELLF